MLRTSRTTTTTTSGSSHTGTTTATTRYFGGTNVPPHMVLFSACRVSLDQPWRRSAKSTTRSCHAGQLRFHDFPKLRKLHQQQRMTSSFVMRLNTINEKARIGHEEISLWRNHSSIRQGSHHHPLPQVRLYWSSTSGSRSFSSDSSSSTLAERLGIGNSTNPFSSWIQNYHLKQLEHKANAALEDADLQSRFLQELVTAGYGSAVLIRMRHPAFQHAAMNVDSAVLYLQQLQRGIGGGSGNAAVAHFDVTDWIHRLQRTLPSPQYPYLSTDRLQQFQQQLLLQKLSKADQVQHCLQFLYSGGTYMPGSTTAAAAGSTTPTTTALGSGPVPLVPAVPYAATTGGMMHPSGLYPMATSAAAASTISRGIDARNPVHVQIVQPPGSGVRGAILGFAARAVLIIVAFSAVGALLDERGLGRGLGMNAGSKHVQEAEQGERKVRFDDVKGVAEAKAELEEIVMYLRDPSRFTRLGGKLPRGVLLTGPPGTGKTLLAKAIAGEANVPFFYSSGSQFEEVYVGLGAKRVRELFEAAKKKAPAIIFIDEIDAVGGTRRLKDQSALKMTLNELLVQLDGFDGNNGIIVIGATNFVESLDSALLRPGRFDKHVTVPLPDIGGRKEILELYAQKTKLAADVDLSVLARGTTGLSGADLYNLINQAALKASVDGLNSITMSVLEYAKDKILMGAERKSAVITPKTARCTAYHEAGHAVVAVFTPGAMPIHKATIMPRGNALGMVTMLPEGDQTSQSYAELLAYMDVAMGGRVAEEVIFGRNAVTNGAMSDLMAASFIARRMVTKYGFSEEVGLVFHGGDSGEESASPETRARIDAEVKKLTDSAYKRAKELLTKHSNEHHLLAETLLEYETLTGDEVRDLVLRRIKPKRPVLQKAHDNSNSSGPNTVKGGGGGSSGHGGSSRGSKLSVIDKDAR